MSDFTSEFWHLYVAGLTILSIVGCLVLLWISGTTKVKASGDNTTGHTWDGDLQEMNNPLPRWWVGLFLITIVFALGYLALYPGLGNNAGKLGWSSAGQYEAEVAKAKKLNVVVGLQRHYQANYREVMKRVHNGDLGEIVGGQVYWNDGGVWVRERKPEQTEMEYQMRNWYYFNWLCGDHIVEQHIHQLGQP